MMEGVKAKEQVPGEGNAEIGRENEEGNEVEKDLQYVEYVGVQQKK